MLFYGTGQINMDSDFGMSIYRICIDDSIRNIIEVGSWNGEGSTICVMNAIIDKPGSTLYSVECDPRMYQMARNFWAKYNTNNRLVLLNGTLHNKVADLDMLNQLYNGNIPYYNEHYVPEKQMAENSPILDVENITDVDVIILDGGEYTSEEDFNVLIKKNPKFICLDDVNVYKCKNIRNQLLNDSNWQLFEENLGQRHGWTVFKRV